MAPNSIALIAENATMLAVANSTLTSAAAFDGADGTDGVQLTAGPNVNGHNGAASGGPYPLAPPVFATPYQPGAAGGVGACVGAAGHDGVSGGKGGKGATQKCGPANIMGNIVYLWTVVSGLPRTDAVPQLGGPGAAGTDGASASSIGAFSAADGYAPAGGTAGAPGSPGNGGTGGNSGPEWGTAGSAADSSLYRIGASGAGGGAGGCPGLGGTAGTGGGASIAALVFASAGLTLTAVELKANSGGRGGKGTFGSLATAGGTAGITAPGASPASSGGAGGRAGFSGNGAGGPSVALSFTGGALVVSPDTHTTAGTAGAGVDARTNPATNVTIPASAAGASSAVLQF